MEDNITDTSKKTITGSVENLSLDNIMLSDQNPDALKAIQDRDKANADKIISDKALDDAEKAKFGVQETDAEKQIRLQAEADKANEVLLNELGDQVDAEGKVIKTKAEIDAELNVVDVPLIEELITTAGVTILDEEGKPKTYTDSIEGIIEYANDIANHKLKESQKDLFKTYPDVEKYLQAKIKGIPDSEFFGNKLTDWKSTVIDETNIEQQLNVISKDLESKGIDKDRVIKMVARIKDSGKDVILEESGLSLKSLQDNQDTFEKNKVEKELEAERIATEKRDNHWSNVNKIITGGKLGDYIIPESDRKAFNEFVSLAADDRGNSAAMIARAKQTEEQKLLLDYYFFKGMNFNNLAKIAVNKAKVDGLRNRIPKINTNGENQPNTGGQQTVNLKDIKLENVVRE